MRAWTQAEANASRAIAEIVASPDFDPAIMKRSARIFIFPRSNEPVLHLGARWLERGYRIKWAGRSLLELVRL